MRYFQELVKGWQGIPSRRICPGHSRSRTFPSWLSGPGIDTGSWRGIALEKKTAAEKAAAQKAAAQEAVFTRFQEVTGQKWPGDMEPHAAQTNRSAHALSRASYGVQNLIFCAYLFRRKRDAY